MSHDFLCANRRLHVDRSPFHTSEVNDSLKIVFQVNRQNYLNKLNFFRLYIQP